MTEAIPTQGFYWNTYKGKKWREFGSQLAFRHFEYLCDDEPSEQSGKGQENGTKVELRAQSRPV